MYQLRAIAAAFNQQWKTTISGLTNFSLLVPHIARSAALAWIVLQGGDKVMLGYMYVGFPLMSIWWGLVFQIGWALNDELFSRTLDFTLISRTPMLSVLFGKTLAVLVFGLPSGVATLVTVSLVVREFPPVAEAALLPFSLLLTFASIALLGLFFAFLMVLSGGRGGFFNAIMPFGAVLSGFVFPVDRLPLALEIPARLLPASWAMDSVWQSIEGPESFWGVLSAWAISILLLVVWFGIIYVLSRVVEKRIRVVGTLGAY